MTENRLDYSPQLTERYRVYFEAVRAPDEVLHPYYPCFHLQGKLSDRSPSFWHSVPRRGEKPLWKLLRLRRRNRT